MKRIGTERPLTGEERQRLIDELNYWHNNSTSFHADREKAAAAFNCEWKNQHISGTMRDRGERKAFPFQGASDQRLRWGKGVCKELSALLMNATAIANVNITCSAGEHMQERANALSALLEWAVSRMGVKWQTQLRTALTYYLRDTPAVALLKVVWNRRTSISVVETDRESMMAEYTVWRTKDGMVSQMDAQGEWWMVLNRLEAAPEVVTVGEEEEAYRNAAAHVLQFCTEGKGIEEKRAISVLKGLATDPDGEVEYVVESVESEGPEIRAMRYGDDFCMPTLTEDFDYADWYEGEWLTKAELEERIATEGWSREWVKETLEHAGANFFDTLKPEYIDENKDLYNIVHCHHVTVDEQGRAWRWTSVLSLADGSAYGKRLVRTRRGKWDAVMLRREINSSNIIDSIGIAEESAPVQGIAKVIRDGAANNAIVGAQAPLKIKGRGIKNALIGPFKRIMMNINDDVTFMQPPQFPAAADKQLDTIKSEFLAFEGVGDAQNDTSNMKQDLVSWWLAQMQELYRLLLEVTQDNASDETLAGITNSHDVKGLRREDIAGDFGIKVVLDQNDLNNESLIKKLQTLGQLIQPLDKNNSLDTYPILADAVRKLLPGVAKESMKTRQEMQQDDVKDEMQNFIKIKAGIMPEVNADGKWNYQARLDFYRSLQENNPAAFEDLSEASRELLGQWIKALEQQATQFGANAQIGRTGVAGVAAE